MRVANVALGDRIWRRLDGRTDQMTRLPSAVPFDPHDYGARLAGRVKATHAHSARVFSSDRRCKTEDAAAQRHCSLGFDDLVVDPVDPKYFTRPPQWSCMYHQLRREREPQKPANAGTDGAPGVAV